MQTRFHSFGPSFSSLISFKGANGPKGPSFGSGAEVLSKRIKKDIFFASDHAKKNESDSGTTLAIDRRIDRQTLVDQYQRSNPQRLMQLIPHYQEWFPQEDRHEIQRRAAFHIYVENAIFLEHPDYNVQKLWDETYKWIHDNAFYTWSR